MHTFISHYIAFILFLCRQKFKYMENHPNFFNWGEPHNFLPCPPIFDLVAPPMLSDKVYSRRGG